MPKDKEDFIRFLKFALTGVANTAVDFAVFYLVSFLGAGVYLAQACGYSAGIINSYTINRSWTFETKEGYLSPQMVKFVLLNLGLLLVSMGVIYLVGGLLGLPKLVAKLFATGVTVIAGFFVNRLWVFQK